MNTPNLPSVTVLLPAYNCADTLSGALDSLLAQSYSDFEIVAVDDGSTDDTAQVLRAYAGRDGRVRPLFEPHQGIVGALNAGLGAARGRYVARMDGDDACHEERLARQAGFLDESPDVGLVSCRVGFGGCEEENAGYAHYVQWTNSLLSPDDIALNRFVESPLAHPSVMFRREVAERHGGYREGRFPEDYELWLRWMEAGVCMQKLPEQLLTWNDPPNRLSRTHENYGIDAFYQVKSEYLYRWLAKNNPHHPEVWVAGAGRVSRKRLEMLVGMGVKVKAYLDIDPRKVGNVIGGVPVISRFDAPEPGNCFVLSYVANRGARDIIAEYFISRGYVPGRDFLLAA